MLMCDYGSDAGEEDETTTFEAAKLCVFALIEYMFVCVECTCMWPVRMCLTVCMYKLYIQEQVERDLPVCSQ